MNVLHIDCSLRQEGSVSREMSQMFIDTLKEMQSIEIDRLDLAFDPPPHISQNYAHAMYVPIEQHTPEMTRELAFSNQLVDRLFEADLVVLGAPMYNFGIPSHLKSYLDHIVRSGRTFGMSETGYEGKVKDTRVVVLNSRGGAYSEETTKGMDFVQPYLRLIFGFIGITDATFIAIEPTAFYGEEAKNAAIEEARKKIEMAVNELSSV